MATLSDFVTLNSDKERAAVGQYLHKREHARILWATRPNPSLCSCTDWQLLLVFGVYVLLFTAGWTVGMAQSEQPLHALWSLPFWCVGLSFLLHPFYRRARKRRSLYVLTPYRVLIIEPQFIRWEVEVWRLKKDLILARRENADGSGDLLFASGVDYPVARDGWRGLPNVRLAEEKLAAALGHEPVVAEVGADSLLPARRSVVERTLLIGERLLWLGHPRPCVEWRGHVADVVFGFHALLFALCIMGAFILSEETVPYEVLMIFGGFAFVLCLWGVILGFKPFWRRWVLARTTYVLTDRRAAIVEPYATHAYPLREGMVVSRLLRQDGAGDLVLEEERCGKPGKNIRRGFLHVPDLGAVERELRKAIVRKRAGRGG